MTDQQISSAKTKGFDPEKYAKMISAQFLLSTVLNGWAQDCNDYLKEYGLSNNFRNDIVAIKRAHENFEKKIRPLIDGKNKVALFDDFDELRNMINEFICKKPKKINDYGNNRIRI